MKVRLSVLMLIVATAACVIKMWFDVGPRNEYPPQRYQWVQRGDRIVSWDLLLNKEHVEPKRPKGKP
jgi:hypothetical protein